MASAQASIAGIVRDESCGVLPGVPWRRAVPRSSRPDFGGSRMTEQVAPRAHGLSGNDAEQLVEGMSIQKGRRT